MSARPLPSANWQDSIKTPGKRYFWRLQIPSVQRATEQLGEWAHRAGVDIISGQEGSDPAAVVFDALAAAKARKADLLLCDTAGRLHNKKNLMEELQKINRIIDRGVSGSQRETLIVLDGTTGQNALVPGPPV